jgi:excisionase family DNA binding protein
MKQHYVYTIREVADLLRVDKQTIQRYIKEGKIKAVKLGTHIVRIPREEIAYLLPKGGQ